MTIRPIGTFYCNTAHKVAYLAIRKCASTSIAGYIAGHKTENILRPLWIPKNAQFNFDLVTTDEKTVSDYFTFTFIRNPYDRFLSFYRNWIVNPPRKRILNHYKKFGVYENMSFNDCVKAFVKIRDISLLEQHVTPMYAYVLRGNTLRVKFIGRLENINVDFEYVKKACTLDGKLTHANRSLSTAVPMNPYTPELRALIYSFYRLDFQLFGYDKQDAYVHSRQDVDSGYSFSELGHPLLAKENKLARVKRRLLVVYNAIPYQIAHVLSGSFRVLRRQVERLLHCFLRRP